MLDYLTALAVAIKSRRRNLGLTQDQAAEKAGIASRTILDISTLFGIVRTLHMDANDIFYPEIKNGTPNQVKLQTTFADCSDSEAEMLYEVCAAVLSSLRKKECAYVETLDKKEPASPVV